MAFLCGSLRRKKKQSDSLSPLEAKQLPRKNAGAGKEEGGSQDGQSQDGRSQDGQSIYSQSTAFSVVSSSGKMPSWACYWRNKHKPGTLLAARGERPRPPGGSSRPHTQGGADGARQRPPGQEEGFWWDTTADFGTPERQDTRQDSGHTGHSGNSKQDHGFLRISSLQLTSPSKSCNSDSDRSSCKLTTKSRTPNKVNKLKANPFQVLREARSSNNSQSGTTESSEPKTLRLEDLTTPPKSKPLTFNSPNKRTAFAPLQRKPLFAPSQESILINSDYEVTHHKSPLKPFKRHSFSASFESQGHEDSFEGQGHLHCQGHQDVSKNRLVGSLDDLQGQGQHQGEGVTGGFYMVSPVLPVTDSMLPPDAEREEDERGEREKGQSSRLGITQGLLQLSIYANHGLLTVHVIQGKNLGRRGFEVKCNSFVKVSLIPSSDERPPCLTEVIYDTNNPVYEDKFSFEVFGGDHKKRLELSVWNQPSDGRDPPRKQLLGCMSFGVRNLLSRKKANVCGWYYLLTEEMGRQKHLKAEPEVYQGLDCIPKVNRALQGRASHKVILNRGKSGYGFTLTGSNPVVVGRVEQGSAAELAGLKQGDAIISVNGKNVSRSRADSVAKIVKNAQSQLLVEFSRRRRPSAGNKENKQPEYNNDYSELHDYGSIDAMHFQENKFEARGSVRRSNRSVTVTKETVTQHTVVRDAVYQSPWQQRRNLYSCHSSGSLEESTASSEEGSFATEDHEMTKAEQERQLAITDLMDCEEQFVSRMQAGVAWYCRPLRHGLLSSQKHAGLFQNIEKLVALSEFHLKQLQAHGEIWCDGRHTGRVLDSVGVHYYPKVLFLCEAYEQYSRGITSSLQMLDNLRKYPEFQHFLSKSSLDESLPTMEEFLHLPLTHIERIFHLLQEILTSTSPDHHDYQALHAVVQSMCRTLYSLSMPAEEQRRSMSACSLSSTESKSSLRSTTSAMSVDSQVLEIQSRLLFPSHVTSFKLAQPNRHFIFSSEAMWVQDGKVWTKVVLLLFNDVILITRAEKGGYHLVMDNPVYLNQVVNTVFSGAHPCEFQIISGHQQRFVTLRALSVEQRCTWKSLLEQRISGSQLAGHNLCDLAIAL